MLKIFKQYYPIRNIFFVLGEGIVIFCSVSLSCILLIDIETLLNDPLIRQKIFLITSIFIVCLYYNDLYNFKVVNSFRELTIRFLQSIGTSAIILAVIYYLFPYTIIYEGVFFVSVFFLIILIISWRLGYGFILKHGYMNQKIMIIGSGDISENIMREIDANIDCGYTVVSHLPPEEVILSKKFTLKPYRNLADYARNLHIEKIVVAIYERRGFFPANELLKCRVAGIEIIEGDSFYESLTGKLLVKHSKPAWLIFSSGFKQSLIKKFFKRLSDLVLSTLFIFLLSPIFILASILVKLDSKGSVFFSQERLGRNKKPYRIYKFRSMVQDAEKQSGPVWAQKEDSRVTRVGLFMRKWRIDEIPQLINIFKGDMSFVGPRPEREYFVNQLEEVIPYYSQRFSIKPGLTGWAQINYSYGDSVEDAIEKLNYDLFYIKNMSFMLDVVIIFRTVRTVLFREGSR